MGGPLNSARNSALHQYKQFRAAMAAAAAAQQPTGNSATISQAMQASFLNPPPPTANPFGPGTEEDTVKVELLGVIGFGKVGPWGFRMSGPTLNVSYNDGTGDFRLEYWVSAAPAGRTLRLCGLDGTSFPVLIQKDAHWFWCHVGDTTTRAPLVRPLDPFGVRPN